MLLAILKIFFIKKLFEKNPQLLHVLKVMMLHVNRKSISIYSCCQVYLETFSSNGWTKCYSCTQVRYMNRTTFWCCTDVVSFFTDSKKNKKKTCFNADASKGLWVKSIKRVRSFCREPWAYIGWKLFLFLACLCVTSPCTSPCCRPAFPSNTGRGKGHSYDTDLNFNFILFCHFCSHGAPLNHFGTSFVSWQCSRLFYWPLNFAFSSFRWLLSGKSWWSLVTVHVERRVCSSSSVRTSSRRCTSLLCSKTILLTSKWTANRYIRFHISDIKKCKSLICLFSWKSVLWVIT